MAYALAETWELPDYGLTFNTGIPDENGCVYWVTEDSGWRGGAAPHPNRQDKSYASGQHRRPNFKTGLKCVWNIAVWAPNPVARALAERKLAAVGGDPFSLFKVIGRDSAGPLFSMMELDGPSLPVPLSLTDVEVSIQFASPDFRRYVDGQTIGGSTGLPASSGGLDWSTGGGLDWDPGLDWGMVTNTGTITFNNTGTADTWPTFTISVTLGPLLNPMITFISTGQRLRYNGILNTGDSLVIDTSEFTRSVTLNGFTDVRTNLNIAEWFTIPAMSSSTVQFTAENVGPDATLTGSAYIAYR